MKVFDNFKAVESKYHGAVSDFNKVIISGSLLRDPVLSFTNKGTSICCLALGVKREWIDSKNNIKCEITHIDAQAYGKNAEFITMYGSEGVKFLIEGELKMLEWETKSKGLRKKQIVSVKKVTPLFPIGPPKKESDKAPYKSVKIVK